MIHTFSIKIETPDNITKAQIVDMFCEATGFSQLGPEGQQMTKAQYVQKNVTNYIIQRIHTFLKVEKEKIVEQELSTEIENFKVG